MPRGMRLSVVVPTPLLAVAAAGGVGAQQSPMTFFITSDAPSKSWNSSHPSRGADGGCSQADLRSTGGDGLFYCLAAN